MGFGIVDCRFGKSKRQRAEGKMSASPSGIEKAPGQDILRLLGLVYSAVLYSRFTFNPFSLRYSFTSLILKRR
jgi:hypothetical protein